MGGLKEGSKEDHQGRQGRGAPPRGEGSAAPVLPPHPVRGKGGAATQPRGQVCVGSGLTGRREEQEKQIVKT